MQDLKFPSSFQWGVATSSYQIEGAVNEGGRAPSIWDTFSHQPGKVDNNDTGDVACDHYHRWQSDLDLIKALGVDAYRFSIAWPRVQPLGSGAWNPAGLAFYDRLTDGLLERGITPHVTLYHWDLPQALQDNGGWTSRDTAKRFADYAQTMAERLGDRAVSFSTHNEPWVTAVLGNQTGLFAPGLKDPVIARRVAHHLLLSHGLALRAIRAAGVKAALGIVLNQSPATPATSSAEDVALAAREYALLVRWFAEPLLLGRYPTAPDLPVCEAIEPGDLETIAQPLDFLGINYYTRIWSSTSNPPVPAPHAQGTSDMGWENYPEGLTELLCGLKRDYPLPPVFITENGLANRDVLVDGKVDDQPRIEYMRTHLSALKAAIDAGVDVRGFFYWSLMDNFEWSSGYAKRFGLVHVDYQTQVRTPKESAHWYRRFIEQQRRA
jgi:beta-glucosidase